VFNFITNLLDHQRAGLDFINRKDDKSVTETITGVQRKIVRSRKYTYLLTLQDLSKNEVKEFVGLLVELQDDNSTFDVPVDLFENYIGKGTTIASFNFNSDDLTQKTKESRSTLTIKLTEVELP